ncbi:hypothetical protein BGZ68_003841 [Mortierella alpina]|nr:hypothetical protein BGZ68_003841 [Mortierella alpina]
MVEINTIKNKLKREELYQKQKNAKAKHKRDRRTALQKEESSNPEKKEKRLAENVPNTLENTREFDETIVEEDAEVAADEETDEFAQYFKNGVAPKILITTSKGPSASVYEFATELVDIFPNTHFVKRRPQFEMRHIIEFSKNRDFTDIMVINEDRKEPNALTLIHLPDGPTAHFKLSSIALSKDIEGHGRTSSHKPELILNNFNTRLGHTIGRMFTALFPHVPEFQGRQVATLHNQRDFIFFRRHRYMFKNAKRVNLQELGPRFTLKLKWLQKGTFDRKGEHEWMFKPEMETSRRRFFFFLSAGTMDTPTSTAGNAAAASAKPMASRSQDDMAHDHDFDELVDEDWLDMDNPPQTLPLLSNTRLASPAKDDHQVPSVPLPKTQQVSAVDTSASATETATEPMVPFALTVSTEDIRSLEQQGREQTPVSSSPSSSDSEFSLLNPSTEQSRKNSISSVAGCHPFTPTGSRKGASPATSEGHLSQEQDYQHAATITSPSFSDFVQVGSDHGDDFSGIDSASARSSSAQTPTSASSDEKDRVAEEEESSSGAAPLDKIDMSNKSDVAAEPSSGERETSLKSHHSTIDATLSSTVASTLHQDALSSASEPSASAPSTVPALKRTMYRTTVEDATSSSEDERQQSPAGIRHRSTHTANADREDIQRSFYSATSTMPGAFNVGLDAELHARTRPAAAHAAPVHEPPIDERQCRICLGGADEEDTLGRLISPCLCKGSMKYVHVECFNAWRARSPKRESHYKCDTCKYSFSFRRTSFARYLAHPLTVFALTVLVFAAAVFAAGFAMKLLLYLTLDEPHDFIYPVDIDDYDADQLVQLRKEMYVFKTPDSLRAVFRIDKTHMVFGSFFVSIIGFMQLLFSTIWMGGGGGVFRVGGFGLGGGRRRGARGERQREAGIGGVVMVVVLVFGLFKSVYMTYQFVNKVSRRVLAKAELMVLEVQ